MTWRRIGLVLALGLCLSRAAGAGTIALTFDDGVELGVHAERSAWTRQLLDTLAHRGVRAMFFPIGSRVAGEGARAQVEAWGRAGHAIGNHTFSHRSLGSPHVTLAAFLQDVQRNDSALRKSAGWTPMLRFPYLKEGDTREKRDGMRAWMRRHGYRCAAVSVDASDWYYSERYVELGAAAPPGRAAALRRAYTDHLLDRAHYYDSRATAMLGRSPAHVLLLHTNALNVDGIGGVIDAFRASGWTIVSPAEAYTDPLYALEPATLPAGESIVWALARERGSAGLRYPAEDGVYEQPRIDRILP